MLWELLLFLKLAHPVRRIAFIYTKVVDSLLSFALYGGLDLSTARYKSTWERSRPHIQPIPIEL